MATRRPAARTRTAAPSKSDEVGEYLRALDHPLKPALELVRSAILGASPAIAEGIKWNSPSFRVTEYFATISVYKKARSPDCVLVVLHLGAKVRDKSAPAPTIRDPGGLLEWLGRDRCTVKFFDLKAVKSHLGALQDIVRQWITFL